MSYRYYMLKNKPLAAFMLEDTSPYFDCTGFGTTGATVGGSSAPTTHPPLVAGATTSRVFSSSRVARFQNRQFKQGLEERPFVLEAWVYPVGKGAVGDQQILSHLGLFDGLSINGTVIKFSTQYTTFGEAACSYDLGQERAAYVVGIHTKFENQLWVNGEFVARVLISDEQQSDTYAASDGFLYCGNTASTQQLAVNAIAFYGSLSGEQIAANYAAGINVTPQDVIPSQFGGTDLDVYAEQGSKFLEFTFDTEEEFRGGLNNNIQYNGAKVVPVQWSGTSEAGSWIGSVPLDVSGDTSIYGVYVEWQGQGVTMEYSLNGTTWNSLTNRRLVGGISPGYNPTNKDLEVRATFPGGIVDDTAYLSDLKIIGFRTAAVTNITARTVSVSTPSILRGNHEPIFYRNDNGVYLNGGTLTISTEPTGDTDEVTKTIEIWVKNNGTTHTLTATGGGTPTEYKNGVAATASTTRGEWSLLHYVYSSAVTSAITISGNVIIGRVVLYSNSLTATEIDTIYKGYTGAPVLQVNDTGGFSVAESATPASIYAYAWAIDAAG